MKEPVVSEPGSSKKNFTGTWRTQRPHIIQNKCRRCGICWTFCPDSCFMIVEEKEDKKFKFRFAINYNYCKGCGICAKECPFKAIVMVEEKK